MHIVYSLFAGEKVIESGSIDRNNQLINRQFTYKDDYENGLLLTFAWFVSVCAIFVLYNYIAILIYSAS